MSDPNQNHDLKEQYPLFHLFGALLQNLCDTVAVHFPHLRTPAAPLPDSSKKLRMESSYANDETATTQVVISNVHDTPKLNSSEPEAIRAFVEKVKSLHASGMNCKVDQWIVNSRDHFSLATNLTGYKILEDRSDFSRVTSNTSLFISKMEQYLIARGNTEGALTLEDKVRKDLKLNIHDVLDIPSVEKLIDKWSRFMEDNKTLLDDKSRSQVPEIKSFLDVNLKGKISDAQGYLMGKVKQFHTTDKPNTLYIVVDKYIDFIFGAQDACRVAKSCGYQICEGPTAKRNFTSADMYATAGSTSASGHGKKVLPSRLQYRLTKGVTRPVKGHYLTYHTTCYLFCYYKHVKAG
jgi:hypothetical protein